MLYGGILLAATRGGTGCAETLSAQLGVQPDEATQQLYRRLFHKVDAPEPHALRLSHPLVGREAEWQALLDAWRRFFALFPDYINTFTRVESRGNLVVLHGYATWEAGAAPDHAIWTARIEGGLVAEWRIYADNEENRHRLGLGESND